MSKSYQSQLWMLSTNSVTRGLWVTHTKKLIYSIQQPLSILIVYIYAASMIPIEKRVDKTQCIDHSHLYHSILHVMYKRMVLSPAITTMWILPGTQTISCHIIGVHFENETKTPNAHLRLNITGYACPDHVINKPCCITYCIISTKVSREISISCNWHVFSWKVIFMSCWYHVLKFDYRVSRVNYCIISLWYRIWRDNFRITRFNYLVSRDNYLESRDNFHEIEIISH